jgi:PKD repeat protein
MKKLSIICLFLCCHLAWGQSKYFEKNTGWYDVQNGQLIIEKSNGDYILLGNCMVNNTYWWHIFNLVVDKNGSFAEIPDYYESPENYGSALFDDIETDYGFAAIGYMVGPDATNVRPLLVKLNHEGEFLDSLWINAYPNATTYTLCRTPDGGYMIGGRARVGIGVGSTFYPYLMRLDEAGNMLWDTIYQINGWQGDAPAFRDIVPNIQDDTYYLNGQIHTFDNSNDVIWCHIDGNGNILQQRTFGNEQNYTEQATGDLIRCSDGTFVFPYSIKANGIWNSGKIIKYDAVADSIVWEKEIFPLGFTYNVKELPDGSLIVAGDASESMDNLPFQAAIAHVKADGEVLWRRLYGGDRPDYLYDFIITSDGSYFFVGRAESNSSADVYLLKTNCMGLLTEPQAAFSATMDTAALTASFQNLSQFVYPDSIDGGHYIWEFGDGAFSSEINPTHTYAQEGVYIVKLTAVVCSDTSTTYQSICIGTSAHPSPSFSHNLQNDNFVTFANTSSNAAGAVFIWDFGDGTVPQIQTDSNSAITHTYTQAGEHEVRLSVVVCQDTTVFVQVVTTFAVGIPSMGMGGFTVYPNPAQDYLVVENNSLEKSATFVLYDVMGRQVLSVVSHHQSVIPIDHLPSGVYLYQFLNPQNQIVAYGKVSVVR